jgi:sugar O-acyltransferase (sialic acid O-acetyltransferase NeuD family)
MNVLIWGAAGQAKVLRPMLERAGHHIALVFDHDPTLPPAFVGVPHLNDKDNLWGWLEERAPSPLGFVVAIGGERGRDRCKIASELVARGLVPVTLCHERSWVADSAVLGPGCQVLAMAAVCVEVKLGQQCIVNTNASVDHECVLGDGVHVMPGATLAGCVEVERYTTIGSNATILPRLRIGEGAMIGAGAVVTGDVSPGSRVAGIPARPLHRQG